MNDVLNNARRKSADMFLAKHRWPNKLVFIDMSMWEVVEEDVWKATVFLENSEGAEKSAICKLTFRSQSFQVIDGAVEVIG